MAKKGKKVKRQTTGSKPKRQKVKESPANGRPTVPRQPKLRPKGEAKPRRMLEQSDAKDRGGKTDQTASDQKRQGKGRLKKKKTNYESTAITVSRKIPANLGGRFRPISG